MSQFNKRGNRIRASDKSLVFRFSAGLLFLLFLAVVMLLNLKTILITDWKAITLFQDGSVHFTVTPHMVVTVIVSVLVCATVALLYQRLQGKAALSPSKAGTHDFREWLAPYPNGNHAGEISRPAPTLGKETRNRLVL